MKTKVGHWKRDACDVYIGRGSLWGNPFVPIGWTKRSKHKVIEAADPLGAYEAYVRSQPELMAELPRLRGKVLGCYCVRLGTPHKPERCHGHVLARMADALRLFRVELGGVVYWILGHEGTAAEMQAAIESAEGITFEGEALGTIAGDDIREVGEAEARELVCRGDGEPDTDMWSAAQAHALTGPRRVVACSEWP